MAVAPAFNAQVKISGAAVATTAEAAALVSGKTYQITNTAKRVLDPSVAVTVKDNGVTVAAANILSLDYLFGIVTFVGGYTVTGPVTFDASYLPTTTIAECKAVEFSFAGELPDATSFDSGGSRRKLLTIVDISGSLTRLALPLDDLDGVTGGTQSIDGWLKAGTQRLVDVLFATGFRVRAWVLFKSYKVTGQLTNVVEVTVEFEGAAWTAGAAFGIGT